MLPRPAGKAVGAPPLLRGSLARFGVASRAVPRRGFAAFDHRGMLPRANHHTPANHS
jgi:hypothetical protein